MCGTAGFISLKNSFPENASDLLKAMGNAIAHRGPNDSGIWVNPKYGVGFAHQRLSIQDVSTGGHQPFFSADSQIQLVFNGEIYNHPELKKELELLGYQYQSNCDTETVMHAYQEWGINCLDRLDGMFAFALHDSKIDKTFLVRDRIGIKPLYFSLQNGMASFASEIKALWLLPWMTKKVSKSAQYHYLTFMVSPSPLTFFEGVYKLPAGFLCTIDEQKSVTFAEWYSPLKSLQKPKDPAFFDRKFCVEKLTDLLLKSVKKRMLADVPVGALLSGGLDSSLIVALMAEHGQKLETCNISFDDSPNHDERIWAQKVATLFGTGHHEVVLHKNEAIDFFPKMHEMLDEPLADPVCIPFYFLLKKIKEIGLSVVLSGEGADELFWGYSSYEKQRRAHHYILQTNRFVPNKLKKGAFWGAKRFLDQDSHYLEYCANWMKNKSLFWGGAIGLSENYKQSLGLSAEIHIQDDEVLQALCKGISDESYSFVDRHIRDLNRACPDAEFSLQVSYLELKQRLPELLLMRVDKMAMAHGVEARVPFLDHAIVEFALQVPESIKCSGGGVLKSLLKEVAEQFLPKEIIYRKKVGFGVPIASWMSDQQLQNALKKQSLVSPKIMNDWTQSKEYKKALYAWIAGHTVN